MEHWKSINQYEGLYEVSNLGNVRSLDRTILNKKREPQYYPGKMLKPDVTSMSNTSYHRVTLSRDHKTRRYSVHRLVAEHFIPNPENKEHVNHINNDGTCNEVQNLEWCTHSENMLHAQTQGRLFRSQSLGGTKAGKLATLRLTAKLQELSGYQIHAWTIVDGVIQRRGRKVYLWCKCDCGTLRLQESTRLLRGETVACSKICREKYKI